MNGIELQKNNKQNRAVIYCRVSTKEQVEEGNSLVTQERACREYAQKHGYEIVETYIEQGESAKTVDRTELKKMMSFCSNKKNDIQAVVAYKIDRISRNTDDYSQIRMNLKRYGVEIKSTSEFFESSPAGRFMENIIANVAQFDNEVRTERCVGGMKGAVTEGRYVWKAPIGYSNVRVNGKATIAPNNQAYLVRELFKNVAKGNRSVMEINQDLFKKGLSKDGATSFAKSRVYAILHDELYIGNIKKFGLRIKGNFEPIISEELFNRVQVVLKTDKPRKPYLINNPDFPLRRFIKSQTGEKLSGAWSKGKFQYYGYYFFRELKVYIAKDVLEKLFVRYFNMFSCTKDQIKYIDKMIHDYIEGMKYRTLSLNNNRQEKEKYLLEKKQQIIDKNLKGIYSDSTAKEQLEQIENDLWEIKSTKQVQDDTSEVPERVFKELNEMLSNPGVYWKKKPFYVKLRFQEFAFPEGLILSDMKLRTPKVCKLYNIKSDILDNLSSIVDYTEPNIELAQTTSPILIDNKLFDEYFHELKCELIKLDKILFEKTEEDEMIESIYSQKVA